MIGVWAIRLAPMGPSETGRSSAMYCGLSALNCFWGSPGAATGETRSLREFVDLAFADVGRSIEWRERNPASTGNAAKRSFASIPRIFRPTEVDLLVGDASKARQKLGWESKTSFAQLVKEMVAGDLAIARREVANGKNPV